MSPLSLFSAPRPRLLESTVDEAKEAASIVLINDPLLTLKLDLAYFLSVCPRSALIAVSR